MLHSSWCSLLRRCPCDCSPAIETQEAPLRELRAALWLVFWLKLLKISLLHLLSVYIKAKQRLHPGPVSLLIGRAIAPSSGAITASRARSSGAGVVWLGWWARATKGADDFGKASFLREVTSESGGASSRCFARRRSSRPGQGPSSLLAAVLQTPILYSFCSSIRFCLWLTLVEQFAARLLQALRSRQIA